MPSAFSFTDRRKAERTELPAEGAWLHHPSSQCPPVGEQGPSLTERLIDAAHRLGFVRVGTIALGQLPNGRLPGGAQLQNWLDRGFAGQMVSYLGADQGPTARDYPGALLDGAQTLIAVALPYELGVKRRLPVLGPHEAIRSAIANYAVGGDYHHAIKDRLLYLSDILADLVGRPVLARACVDTAPLLEREAAQMAGLGFLGKNTMLIAPGQGSGILLGALLTDVPLAREMSQPEAPGPGCGRCRACLDACPTQAFVGEYLLDARRCISYLTIELEGSVPRELRPLVGTRVFGCDECQTTCPFNQGRRQAPGAPEFAPRGAVTTKTLIDLLFLGSAQYRALARGTALRRTFRIQLCRNAAVALGNSGSAEAIAPLLRAAESHAFELVREHAAWGLGRLGWEFGHDQARKALAELASSPLEAVAREAKIWLDLAPMAPR